MRANESKHERKTTNYDHYCFVPRPNNTVLCRGESIWGTPTATSSADYQPFQIIYWSEKGHITWFLIQIVFFHSFSPNEDINECQINNHDCLETQRCDNTIGSYTCIRLQSCGTGYTLNAGTGFCDDDDECILGRHNCVRPYECRNTKGSFRCDKPRYTTTAATTRTTSTTPRLPYYVPPQVYTQTYSRFTVQSTTPNPKIDEWNRSFGPCNVGFERNTLGACSGQLLHSIFLHLIISSTYHINV